MPSNASPSGGQGKGPPDIGTTGFDRHQPKLALGRPMVVGWPKEKGVLCGLVLVLIRTERNCVDVVRESEEDRGEERPGGLVRSFRVQPSPT